MKRTIYICDVESDYSYGLMEAVNRRRACPFEMQAYTTPETLTEALRTGLPDILLISPAFLSEAVEECGVKDIILLTEGRDTDIREKYGTIYKYQSAHSVIQSVIHQYKGMDDLGCENTGRTANMIGVYSPLHRIGKTTFSLAMGQELGEREKVLYLNLENHSGFPALLGSECDVDLSDLLYYARQDERLLARQLGGVIQTLHSLDYIPPARITSDLVEISSEEWNHLFDQLERGDIYNTIIIDFGEGVQGLLGLLGRCRKIYMPVAADFVSQGKIRQYEEMLEALDYSELLTKTEKVILPISESIGDSSLYIGEFLWGPMTGFARSLLAAESPY